MKIWLALIFAIFLAAPSYGALVHDYQLNGTYADALGGPALTPAGGTLGASGYSFGQGQGLSLANGFPRPANYSIEMVFSFSDLTNYRRVIEFKDRASDLGLYFRDASLDFYNYVIAPSTSILRDKLIRLILTRDAANASVVGYVNGIAQLQFTDSSEDGVFNGTSNIAWFFMDDLIAPGEDSPGVVDLIRIYDAPLSAADVLALDGPPSPVPVIPTLSLIGLGGLGLGIGGRQRRRRSKSPACGRSWAG